MLATRQNVWNWLYLHSSSLLLPKYVKNLFFHKDFHKDFHKCHHNAESGFLYLTYNVIQLLPVIMLPSSR